MDESLSVTVSEFVDLFNQTLEFAYPGIYITGELANLRVSKNRWVYFDLKDEGSTLKFFGTVYQLPGPLEDGMLLKVKGQPHLHNLYGFSVNVLSIQPAGEGSIRKAANLLQAKLTAEGLFDESRKRYIPYPPDRIGLITSKQSAAYADFIKILNTRWGGVQIDLIDVQVQGEAATGQIVAALEQFNAHPDPPEVLIFIRGGGSAEDLATFSTEQVTRAVAASRVPTLVAIGHEIDVSLAELAADKRASTPSNAAELLTPDRKNSMAELISVEKQIKQSVKHQFELVRSDLMHLSTELGNVLDNLILQAKSSLKSQVSLIEAFSPEAVLRRGYAIVREKHSGKILRNVSDIKLKDLIDIKLSVGELEASVNTVKLSNGKGITK